MSGRSLKMRIGWVSVFLFSLLATTMNLSAQQNKSTVSDQQAGKDNDQVYEKVEHLPYYVSTEPYEDVPAIMGFISKNITYPKDAWEIEKQGTVLCELVINKDGSFSDIKVKRSLYPSLDKEAVRVLSTFPKWKPGKHKGEIVRVRYTLPVVFRMREAENNMK